MQKTETPKITRENFKTGLRVIVQHLLLYKKEATIISFLGIISAVGNGTIPYITGKFFDYLISPETRYTLGFLDLPLFIFLLIGWFIVQIITYLFDWQINIRSDRLANFVWTRYLSYGFSYLFELPMSFHKKHKIGSVGDKINRAANALETIIGRIIIELSPQILSIAIALSIAYFLQPFLATILVVGLGVYLIILIKRVKPLAAIQKGFHDQINDTWGDMYDAIGNVSTIKQNTTETHEREKLFDRLHNQVIALWNKMNKVWSDLNFYQRLTILCTQTAIFIASIIYISNGSLTIGELIAFNAYAGMVFGPFVTIGRNWQTIQNGIINLHEAEKFLTTPKEIYQPTNKIDINEIKGDIIFDHVYFHYDKDKPVLQDISFNVKAGDVIALVGESGVGKSTLIDLISAYHFPEQGFVLIDGHDIRRISLSFLRAHIAIVPQEVVLFNDTILKNIKYGNFEATEAKVIEAARKAHALEFIEKFPEKWNQMVGERGVKLSVGQKQRVAIARAILRNPKILILDEPTSALDAGSENIITKSLEELMAGKTTFIIAHRLSTVRKADKILVFKEGKIIEQGKHEELIRKIDGEYKRLYELQIGLHQ